MRKRDGCREGEGPVWVKGNRGKGREGARGRKEKGGKRGERGRKATGRG